MNQNTYDPGDCYTAAPLCNNTTKYLTGNNSPDSSACSENDNYTWVCTSGNPPNNHTNKFRSSFVDSNPGQSGTGTYTVTLAAGCTFNKGNGVGQTDYAGGRQLQLDRQRW